MSATCKPEEGQLPLEGLEAQTGEPRPAPRYRPIDRAQVRLVTLDIEALVGPDHVVRAIWELVGSLNLEAYEKPIKAVEGVAGRTPADVRMLISIWVYAFSMGTTSGRQLERMFAWEAGLRWLSGDQKMGYHTLNDFRSQNEEALKQLFVNVLGTMRSEGLVELKRVLQDGTKVKAAAGADSFRSKKHISAALAEAEQHVEELLKQEAESNPQQSVREAAARKRAAEEQEEKLRAAREALKQVEQTRKKKGKDPDEARASVTDPDARVMRQDGGGSKAAYNAQSVVDAQHGVIVASFVDQSSSDGALLSQGLEEVRQNTGVRPAEVVADAGYTSKRTITAMAEQGVDFYGSLPDLDERNDSPLEKEFRNEAFAYNAETDACTCPAGQCLPRLSAREDQKTGQSIHVYRAAKEVCAACPLKTRCCPKARKSGRSVQRIVEGEALRQFREKMQTEEARAIYRQRSQRAEFPFAVIKQRMGLRQFRLRGLVKVGMEWMWACLTFNLLQWIRLRREQKCVLAAA